MYPCLCTTLYLSALWLLHHWTDDDTWWAHRPATTLSLKPIKPGRCYSAHLNSVVKLNLNYLLVHASVLEIKTFESPVLLLNPLETFNVNRNHHHHRPPPFSSRSLDPAAFFLTSWLPLSTASSPPTTTNGRTENDCVKSRSWKSSGQWYAKDYRFLAIRSSTYLRRKDPQSASTAVAVAAAYLTRMLFLHHHLLLILPIFSSAIANVAFLGAANG